MQDPRPQAQFLVRDDDSSLCLLWVWYRANGGEARLEEFDAYLHGLLVLDPFDLKILAWAMEDYGRASVSRSQG
jgi:hypothetical protein